MEELFGSQHKNKNMQIRHTRCVCGTESRGTKGNIKGVVEQKTT